MNTKTDKNKDERTERVIAEIVYLVGNNLLGHGGEQRHRYDALLDLVWDAEVDVPKYLTYLADISEPPYKEAFAAVRDRMGWLESPIHNLPWRRRNTPIILRAAGIETIGDLLRTEIPLLAIKNFGNKALADVENVLKPLDLPMPPVSPSDLDL